MKTKKTKQANRSVVDTQERATLRIGEAAAIAGCNHKVIRKYVALGILPRLELTRTILIPRAAFIRFLENAGRPVE
jgi:hypothetical protein